MSAIITENTRIKTYGSKYVSFLFSLLKNTMLLSGEKSITFIQASSINIHIFHLSVGLANIFFIFSIPNKLVPNLYNLV